MKRFRLSTTSWQAILLGILAVFLWWGSKPAPGADGRIVCFSPDYPDRIPFTRHEPFLAGSKISIIVMIDSDGRLRTQNRLVGIPVVNVIKNVPNKMLRSICKYIPALSGLPQLEWRMQGGWVYYFSLTPGDWEILEEARRNGKNLLFLPDEMAKGVHEGK